MSLDNKLFFDMINSGKEMKEEIIKILDNIAKLLEIQGESFFKISAYSKASEILKNNDYDIGELVHSGKLSEINGFGKALTEKISDYVNNRKMTYYENLTKEFPESLIELLKIDGMGPKKILQLFKELNVKTISELEQACLDGKIAKVKGFTTQSSAKILDSVNAYKSSSNYKERKIDFDQIQ